MRKAARKWFVCPQAVIIGKQMRIPTKCRFAMAAGMRNSTPRSRRSIDLPWKEAVLFICATGRGVTKQGRLRQRGNTLVSLALVLVLSACQSLNGGMYDEALKPSSDPVTAANVTRDNKLVQLARQQHPRILNTYGGEYSNPKLERMVAKVVGRLTLVSDNPSQIYRITILNSPSVNAFALPGGYLYITRGLLALANDSAELAAVIAHEMGHVTANHGLQRQQLEAEEALTSHVVADLLSNDREAKTALIRGKLKLAQFSRNQELAADAIGINSVGKAGFDPYAASRFLRAMQAYTDFRSVSGANDTSLDFLATHPNTPQRVSLAVEKARAFGPPGTGERDRDAYLRGIDGMLFGDKPDEGYVRGNTFLHPKLGITFTVPQGFVIDNSAQAVTAAGPGDIAVRFDGVSVNRGTPLQDYVRSGWVTGLDPSSVHPATINGNEAAVARAASEGWQFDVTVIRADGQVYRLLTAAPMASHDLEKVARSVSGSFRLLTKAEKASLKPLSIRIVTVSTGQNIASVAAMMRGVDRKLDLFRVLNGMGPGADVSVGDKVKIVTDE
jgi:predicted Zn-dependent protease